MLDEVELVDLFEGVSTTVYSETVLLNSNTVTGTVSIPEGLDAYEEIYCSMFANAEPDTVLGTDTITKEDILIGNVWQVNASDASTTIRCNMTFTDNNTITISGAVSGGISFLKGRKKRYATETNTVLLPVNNGAAIGTLYREKIPANMLPSSMLTDAGKIKDSVSVEVVIDYDGSAGGDSGEGDPMWIFYGGTGSYGVKVSILDGDFMVVQSGSLSIMARSADSGSSFGSTSTLEGTATARVKVTNTERFSKPIV